MIWGIISERTNNPIISETPVLYTMPSRGSAGNHGFPWILKIWGYQNLQKLMFYLIEAGQSEAGFGPGLENSSINGSSWVSGGPPDGMVYRKGGS